MLYKTYRIRSDRSEWICQSLLGRPVDRLYPCHVCYAVFEAGEELRAHFAAAHPPGTLNRSASTLPLVHEAYYRGKCGASG